MIDLNGGPCVAKRLSGCGSGCEYLAVTPWGDFYPCHQFVGNEKFLMGNVDEGITRTDIREEFKTAMFILRKNVKNALQSFTAAAAVRPIHTISTVISTMLMIQVVNCREKELNVRL